jgi:cell wall-associated NlpC family hydrolase
VLWSAVLGAAVAFAFANPVFAEPPLPNTIPDTGSRPQLGITGTIQLPGPVSVSPGTTGAIPGLTGNGGPLAGQIYSMQTELNLLGDELLLLRQSRDTADIELKTATDNLTVAQGHLTTAQQAAETSAAKAIKEAAGLPPGAFGSDLHGLGALSRIQKGSQDGGDSSAAARELSRATVAEKSAREAQAAAGTRSTGAINKFATAEASFKTKEAALVKLRQENATALAAIEAAQEAAEQQLGAQYLNGENVGGTTAHPRALAAVAYAKAQLGDPYLWGAEGPSRFDCSGLMYAAYRSPGADYDALPRVARDQYNFTRLREVDRTQLLPGDLLFFASNSSWTSVHHVGMYIGGGRMVHAPNSGDVVKISVVSWSRLYKATRVFGAVPAPQTTPPRTNPNPTTTTKPPATKPPTTPPTKPPLTPSPTPPPPTPPTTPPTTPPETPPTTPPADPPETTPAAETPSGSTSGQASPNVD